MSATVPYAYESRVLNKNIDKVWSTIRNLDFKFWKLVKKVEVKSDSGLGWDGTNVSNRRIVRYNCMIYIVYIDLDHTIKYEMIKSEPPVDVMSILNTLKDNTSFIEFHTEYTADCKADRIQDAVFKKKEALSDLADYLDKN